MEYEKRVHTRQSADLELTLEVMTDTQQCESRSLLEASTMPQTVRAASSFVREFQFEQNRIFAVNTPF